MCRREGAWRFTECTEELIADRVSEQLKCRYDLEAGIAS